MDTAKLVHRTNVLRDRDGVLFERRQKGKSSSRSRGAKSKDGIFWKIAHNTLTCCNCILSWLFRLLIWMLSSILSRFFPLILAVSILCSLLYFVLPYVLPIRTLSVMLSHVPSLLSGIGVRMWCSNGGWGCSPPVMTEEKFTEVMSPQFDVAVDLFDHLVKVEELQKTADFEKRYTARPVLILTL